MRMLVLGAGLQGSACAYDLLQNPAVTEVRLADLHVDHLTHFLAPYSGKRLLPTRLDVRDAEAVRAVMRESDAVMSAIPYYFNLDLARLAVEAGTHFYQYEVRSPWFEDFEDIFADIAVGETEAGAGESEDEDPMSGYFSRN